MGPEGPWRHALAGADGDHGADGDDAYDDGASDGVEVDDVARVAERLALAVEAGLPWSQGWEHARAEHVLVRAAEGPDPRSARARLHVLVAVDLVVRLGAPGVLVLRRAAAAARESAALDAERSAAVAGPAASARVVAAMPLAGPLLGVVLGVDPVGVLLHTAWGRVCGVLGLALLVVSWWWSSRLVRAAARAAGLGASGVDGATVCELVGAALGSGTGVTTALRAVATSLDGVTGADANGTAAQLRRVADGLDVDDLRLVRVDADLQPLLAAVRFSRDTGTPAARPLDLAAAEGRQRARSRARTATARLGAVLVLPLGLAALPGFLLLGVAPVVVTVVSGGLSA